ncbi:MAG: hypothetical protein AVDCRST_MAG24-394, partial [uncultured Nocardioidaceae bacterium]
WLRRLGSTSRSTTSGSPSWSGSRPMSRWPSPCSGPTRHPCCRAGSARSSAGRCPPSSRTAPASCSSDSSPSPTTSPSGSPPRARSGPCTSASATPRTPTSRSTSTSTP